ncbi:MAG: hypothetical protein V4451_05780 [Pseudomonadota bacterium]
MQLLGLDISAGQQWLLGGIGALATAFVSYQLGLHSAKQARRVAAAATFRQTVFELESALPSPAVEVATGEKVLISWHPIAAQVVEKTRVAKSILDPYLTEKERVKVQASYMALLTHFLIKFDQVTYPQGNRSRSEELTVRSEFRLLLRDAALAASHV